MADGPVLARASLLLAGALALSAGAAVGEPARAPVGPGGPDGPGAGRRVVHSLMRAAGPARAPQGRAPFLLQRENGRLLARVRTIRLEIFEREAARLGVEVRALLGGTASIEAPEEALEALASIPGVVSVKPARAYRTTLDISTAEVEADVAAAAYGGTGRGVIIAVIDTGLDFRHEDFRNPDGTSRVLAVWDQTDSTGGGAGCGPGVTMGRCYTKAQLDADLSGGTPVNFQDGHGHGTHVAGIAAGNGRAAANGVAEGTYAGVAPEADLLIVKVFTPSGYFVGDLPAAYAWIASQSASFGKPFVINMSLGDDLGPHDGTDADEIALDALLAPGTPGRAAAIAAGNSRNSGIHVEGAAAPGASNDHPFLIPSYTPLSGADNDAIYLDMWYEGGDTMTVSVLDAGDNVLASAAPGGSSGLRCTSGGGILVDATNVSDPDNGDGEVFILIADDSACAPATAPPPGQTLKVRVTGASTPAGGVYHIWSEAFLGPNPTSVTFTPATESTLVGMPATARNAVAVGSYVTRSCWPDADPNTSGPSCLPVSAPVGVASWFSSNGPTRDGRAKPEVSAPGEWIASALTSAKPTLPLSRRTPDGFHWTLRGTSMASPHAAGALAILLQANPGLDAAQARDLLSEGSRADGATGAVPNDLYGSGKLSAAGGEESVLKLVAELQCDTSGTLLWAPEPHSLTYNVYRGDLPGSLPSSYGSCLAADLPSPSFDDPAAPSPGEGFLYLVTGVRDGIEGSLGFDSEGIRRPNVSPCP